MYILHTRDTVCDDHPSSSTTGHDFAKSSRRAHSGLFIVVTNGAALICLLCSTMQVDMIVKKMLIFFAGFTLRGKDATTQAHAFLPTVPKQ